jgi:hemoglobin/transferrin/lactoferrin receptor protein
MKNFINTLLLVLVTIVSFGQEVTLLDLTNMQAISDVKVYAASAPTQIATSNENGIVDIKDINKEGMLIFHHPQYHVMMLSFSELAKTNFTLYLMENTFSMEEVVVSASKFEEKKKDVAQSIQIIRRSDIENMNQSSMADVMDNSGKVLVQKSQLGGGSPIIRGFETNKVLMVVDGVRMNNAIYRGGHLQNIVTLDNATMDRIEVVFGPGSVVYGSDALGGVMNFYTKNPILSTNNKTQVKAGAYTRYMSACSGYAANANVSVGSQKFGSLSSFTYSNYGDLRQGAVRNPAYGSFGIRPWYVERINNMDSVISNSDTNLQVKSGYAQIDILQKFIYKPSKYVSHTFNFQYSTSSDINRYDRLTQTSGTNPKYAEWYYGPQNRAFAAYTIQLTKNTRLYDHARIILGYQNIEESRISRKFSNDSRRHQIEKLSIFSLNADFAKKMNRHEIRYGLEAYTNDVNSTAFNEDIITGSTEVGETRYPDGGSQMHAAAVYATHTYEINEKLILNDGLRYNFIQLNANFVDKSFFPFPFSSIEQNNTAVNGNIGLIYTPTNSWRFTLTGATGFRAPNVDDISKVFESNKGTIIVPNPNLKPENTYNAEFGVSKTINDRVTFSGVGYYTHYVNALTTGLGTFNGADSILYDGVMSGIQTTINAGKAYLYGFEGGISGNLNEHLSINATINYTYGRIETDTTDYPLDHIPPVFGKISFNYKAKKFRSEAYVRYNGMKRLEDYNIAGEDNISFATPYGMPAWYTVNLRLSYQLMKQVNLQVACENIFDVNYRQFASNISAPGRNFLVTLRGNF